MHFNFNAALWWLKTQLHLQKILISKLNFISTFNLKSKSEFRFYFIVKSVFEGNFNFHKFYECIKPFTRDIKPFLCSCDIKCNISRQVWTEVHPKASRTFKMEIFAKLVTSWKLIIFAKSSILNCEWLLNAPLLPKGN